MELGKQNSDFTRPILTVVKSTSLLAVKKVFEVGEKKKAKDKMNMPEQKHGYIKVRKHDCL